MNSPRMKRNVPFLLCTRSTLYRPTHTQRHTSCPGRSPPPSPTPSPSARSRAKDHSRLRSLYVWSPFFTNLFAFGVMSKSVPELIVSSSPQERIIVYSRRAWSPPHTPSIPKTPAKPNTPLPNIAASTASLPSTAPIRISKVKTAGIEQKWRRARSRRAMSMRDRGRHS